MSIIVYGPQGTGKTLHAAVIAAHFKCTEIVECESDGLCYRYATAQPEGFKAGAVLFLTNEPPPFELAAAHRVIASQRIVAIADLIDPLALSLPEGARAIGLEYEIRYYLAGPARKTNEITVSTLMSALGYPIHLQALRQTKEAANALQKLGWLRTRGYHDHNNVRPWIYQRPPTVQAKHELHACLTTTTTEGTSL